MAEHLRGRGHRQCAADGGPLECDQGALEHEGTTDGRGRRTDAAQHSDLAAPFPHGPDHDDTDAGDPDQEAEHQVALQAPKEPQVLLQPLSLLLVGGDVLPHLGGIVEAREPRVGRSRCDSGRAVGGRSGRAGPGSRRARRSLRCW